MINPIFLLNHRRAETRCESGTPLLDVIRHDFRLTGCKEGCHAGDCGSCLALLGKQEATGTSYQAVTACLLPIDKVIGHHVVTIEGLNGEGLNPIQQALVDQGAIQCGFCTPGLVLALTAFFLNAHRADVELAIDAVAGNLCRCTGYSGIKRAIAQLCERFDLSRSPRANRIQDCIDWQLLPPYFAQVSSQLSGLPAQPPVVVEKNPDAFRVAGGTDVLAQPPAPSAGRKWFFLSPATNENAVRLANGRCIIDAGASIEQLRTNALMQNLLPNIADDLRYLCSPSIRQQATLGGNLANASPIGDLSIYFLALDANLQLSLAGKTRECRLRDFFTAYKQTACQAGEQLISLDFEAVTANRFFSFEKVGLRPFLDIACVNSALSMRLSNGLIESIHVAAGGVAPVPLYLTATCDYLRHKPVNATNIRAAAKLAQEEIAPIADLRGSIAYKRLLLRQLLFAHFLKLFPEQLDWESLACD